MTRDVTGAETHGTITTVAESPMRPGILWAGTDDGNVWLSASDGATWTNLTGRFPGVPPKTWVSRVEPSHFDSATAYVSFDGHRDDNFHPYVFVTNDFGRTFRSIAADLPASEYVHVVREHPRRRELLFVGTELAAYLSTDAGGSWIRLMSGMPPVPVHDLVIHPRDKALVAATHGRSIFVMDIGPLEEATDSILAAPSHLFAVEPALLYNERGVGGGGGGDAVGHKIFSAQNAPFGARIAFRIAGPSTPADTIVVAAGADGDSAEDMAPEPPAGRAPRRPRVDSLVFVITNAQGDTVRTLRAQGGVAALRWVTWDLRRNRQPLGPAARRDSIRAAQRQAFLRDSVRAAVRDTAAGRPRLPPGRDPEPGEPGTPVLPPGFGPPGGFGGGGGGFGGPGQARMVEPGIYFVTVRLGGVEHRRVIRVERPSEPHSALAGGWQ
ncbi:MAG: hypothetical protein HYR48_01800 [Gemmatimonadetes bacterium]|nr:hypothetical protein [Gemmatimonadota bacterium]